MNKAILVLKGENKLDGFLTTLKLQKQTVNILPNILSKVNFVFSTGEEEINILDYQLVVLLSNPDEQIWSLIVEAEKNKIPTINNSNLLLKYNDCLQTQLDLQHWGFNIPNLGEKGVKKERFHEMRKNGKKAILPCNSLNLNAKNSYYEQYIEGELFKIKVLGMEKSYVVHIEKNGKNGSQRTDKTREYYWLGELGLKIAQRVKAELLSIDIIVEKTTGLPYCIDVNLGNALTGVNNGAIELLSYLAHRINTIDPLFKIKTLSRN